MTKCRTNGDALRRAGMITAIVGLLRLPNGVVNDVMEKELFEEALRCSRGEYSTKGDEVVDDALDPSSTRERIRLATAAAAAIRDLSCGSAPVRVEVRESGGIPHLVSLLSRSRGVPWEDLAAARTAGGVRDENVVGMDNGYIRGEGDEELRLLTAACGAVKNVAHSSRENSDMLHECGATEELSWRLLSGHDGHEGATTASNDARPFEAAPCEPHSARAMVGSVDDPTTATPGDDNKTTLGRRLLLPDAGLPWREACYRASGALINMAEKSVSCAARCASDPNLVDLLVESWGGRDVRKKGGGGMVLHLGLAAVLRRAEELWSGGLPEDLECILIREDRRRREAQRREEERKRRKAPSVPVAGISGRGPTTTGTS